jgi:hypothetical protein
VLLQLEAVGMSSKTQERIFWGAWPIAGFVADDAGAIGCRGSTHRVLGRVGFFLGLVELLATSLIVFAIVRAFRDLG